MNCPKCGKLVDGAFSFCEHCGSPIRQQEPTCGQKSDWQPNYAQQLYQQTAYDQPQKSEKRENVVAGTVGALIGSLIGAVVIIVFSRLGLVSALSGLILAVCSLKGYELLGGKLSTKGIIISIVLMLVTPYIADRIDWALMLMDESSRYTFAEAYAEIPELIGNESKYLYIESDSYYTNLAMLYGFALLGAFSTVWNKIKEREK